MLVLSLYSPLNLDAYKFRTIITSWLTDPLILVLTLSLVSIFVVKNQLCLMSVVGYVKCIVLQPVSGTFSYKAETPSMK